MNESLSNAVLQHWAESGHDEVRAMAEELLQRRTYEKWFDEMIASFKKPKPQAERKDADHDRTHVV
jgi:hypothetical protein